MLTTRLKRALVVTATATLVLVAVTFADNTVPDGDDGRCDSASRSEQSVSAVQSASACRDQSSMEAQQEQTPSQTVRQ